MYHLPILRTVNLKGRQNGRQFVPVDTKTVSLKLHHPNWVHKTTTSSV